MTTVNFVTGMDCALGIESLGGQLRNEAVMRTDPVISNVPGQNQVLAFSLIESQESLESLLNLSADLGAGFSFFGGDRSSSGNITDCFVIDFCSDLSPA